MAVIKTPVVIINLKTYPQATGEKAVLLAQTCERVSKQYDVPIVVAPQIPDVYRVSKAVEIPVFSQHMDPGAPGRFTGHTLGETLVEAGCSGTLLNHSENRMVLADIEAAVAKARNLNLYTVVCTNNPAVSVAAATLNPDAVAVEPPELIGTGISVSQAQPEIISGTVEMIRRVNKDVVILCGAGIGTGDDVAAAIKLGAQGVLLASAVAKSDKPEDVLADLVSPLKK
ncbi:MAG: triose-phosphate isomerase [Candidatus Thorarchaeota archaeon]|nr:MAG: triose-phosphate isomerase [Candidatus Thorarchaeota archaeon]